MTFLVALCHLRWLAVLCQAIVLVIVLEWLDAHVDRSALWSATATLAGFNVYATWRSRRARQASNLEIVLHIAVDVSVLAWLIAWSGGVANPFTSLFLLPIAFAAMALPPRWIYVVAGLCGLAYALSAWLGRPFPHVHGFAGSAFDLHLWGMAVNFLISVGVVVYFFARLAVALRQREQELARLRERFARNEGILALATHAAAVAHELNTPLATMTLALDDLIEQAPPSSSRDELEDVRGLVDVCRDRVRELAAPAMGVDRGAQNQRLLLDHIIDRWQLVRPTIRLQRQGSIEPAHAEVDATVGHLLQALLNNAADASEANASNRVDLMLSADATGLRGEIRDYGAGLSDLHSAMIGTLHHTTKAEGLGIGLALSHATVERLGGDLTMVPAGDIGVRVRFHLPSTGFQHS
ncbi:sensor histidine kinase [Ahniella affigens]|uniref:histidine kinase n=1 Tax=Ahniella affigens TaxID=2021234 RepID=A0A2P1PYZ1_9GAMM|nr:ATP-binding protein [Ahniella affigens]AVQ00058.1 sensor histidine kinase [Ahniella affigens]